MRILQIRARIYLDYRTIHNEQVLKIGIDSALLMLSQLKFYVIIFFQ